MKTTKRTQWLLLSLFLTIVPVTFVQAGPLEDAQAAYSRGDYAAAIRSFRLLAEQGNSMAQYNLRLMYANGQGVLQDYVKAHIWFNLAASRFTTAEDEKRAYAVAGRDRAAARMTAADIAEAQKLVREWKPTKRWRCA